MSKAKAAFWSAFIGTIAVIILLIFWSPKGQPAVPKTTPVKTEQACSKDPCIEIIQANGEKYQLNDFRFITDNGKKCILFITIPAGEHKEACGDYKLNWIGPDNSEQKQGTPISI